MNNTPYVICKYIICLYLYLLFKYSIIYAILVFIGMFIYKEVHQKNFQRTIFNKKTTVNRIKEFFAVMFEFIYLFGIFILFFYLTYIIKLFRENNFKKDILIYLFFILIILGICLFYLIFICNLKAKNIKAENIFNIFWCILFIILGIFVIFLFVNVFTFNYLLSFNEKLNNKIKESKREIDLIH